GRRRWFPGALVAQALVSFAKKLRDEFGGDVERYRCGLDAVLTRGLQEFRWETRLTEQDPHRRHCGRARTKVKRQRGVASPIAECTNTGPYGRFVDLYKVHGPRKLLEQQLDWRLGAARKPLQIGLDVCFRIVREEKRFIEIAGFECLGDGSQPNRMALRGRPK